VAPLRHSRGEGVRARANILFVFIVQFELPTRPNHCNTRRPVFLQTRGPDWHWPMHGRQQWHGHEFESGIERAPIRRGEAAEKIFLVVPLHFLPLKLNAQIVVLVSAVVMVSTVWSVSCLQFFYSRSLPVPSHF